MSEFVFPFKFEDILEETTDSRYCVQSKDNVENADERKIEKKLEEIERDLTETWRNICEPSNFDFIFYFIRCLEPGKEAFSLRLVQFVPEILIQALEKLIKDVAVESSRDNKDTMTLDGMRNSLKMIVFLILYFLNNTSIKKAKLSLKDELNDMTKDTKKGKSKKVKKELNKDHQTVIIEKQAQALAILRKTLSINLRYVWNKRHIDDEFFKYFLEVSLKMLESKILLKETKNAKDDIFSILESTLSEHEGSLKNVEIKLINLIYEEETLVDPIADFIVKASKAHNPIISKLATDFLTVLVNYVLEKTNVSAESQAVKNTKELISKISSQIPRLFFYNLSTFICLYESDAYLLRNGLTDVIGEIIKKVLTSKEGEDEDLDNKESRIKQKTRLLDKLVKRINDKHAFARAHVFKVFIDLCTSNVVPKEYLSVLLRCACERIQDVSANVRKKAIELLNVLVGMYYGIFVENKERGFLSKEDLEREKKYTQSEINNLEAKIKKTKEEMKNFVEESDEQNELADDLKVMTGRWSHLDNTKKHIEEYIALLAQLEKIIPFLVQLLGSKNSGDVVETIRLLISLKGCRFHQADVGIRKMLVLIWSKERAITEELLRAYWQLYFDCDAYTTEKVAGNLIHLYNRANLTEKTSLEELISYVLSPATDDKEKKMKDMFYFPEAVFKILWNIFLVGFQNMEKLAGDDSDPKAKEERLSVRSALEILRTVYSKKRDILDDKLESFNIILRSFIKNYNPDWIFCKEIAQILEISKESSPRTNAIIKSLIMLLMKWHGTDNSEWYCACEQVINMIFSLKVNPEPLTQYLILQCSKFLVSKEKVTHLSPGNESSQLMYPSSPGLSQASPIHGRDDENVGNISMDKNDDNFEDKLAQLLFVVGHAAVRLLIHFDNIENYFKHMKNEAETKAQAGKKNSREEELEKISGGMEADIERKIDQLHKLSEKFIVQKNLLSNYVPLMKNLVMEIIQKKASVRNPLVERSCILALCKFMTVSSEFCEKNLNLLFGLLKCKIDPITKTNIIISIGDLIHRFPNTTEPYTSNLYQNLQDDSPSVRKTTLMVITHLILNDMLKLKGEISDIALLFEDPDSRIQNLVKLFFHELHKKDSKTIYNLMPEAIGRLSRMSHVTETMFQNFARNIMVYVEKEKFSETLVEKLTARFANCDNEKDWRNSAYCLSLLSYNEKGIRKLIDNFEFYREKLQDDQVNDSFKNLLSKLKKFTKQEHKILIDEWESKLNNFMKEGVEPKRKVPEAAKKKKKGKSAKETEMDEEKGDEDSQALTQTQDEKPESKRKVKQLKKPAPKPEVNEEKERPKRAAKKRKAIVEEDEEEEERNDGSDDDEYY